MAQEEFQQGKGWEGDGDVGKHQENPFRRGTGNDFPEGEGAERALKGNSRVSGRGKRRWETPSGKQQIRTLRGKRFQP